MAVLGFLIGLDFKSLLL